MTFDPHALSLVTDNQLLLLTGVNERFDSQILNMHLTIYF